MLTIISLAGLLASPLYSANGYSPSERRTLQTALEMSLQYAELNRFQQSCLEQQPGSEVAKTYPVIPVDIQQHNLLLQQKLKMSELSSIALIDGKMTRFVQRNIPKLTDCENSQSYQSLLDNYELSHFSLEIATELQQAPQSADANNQRLAAAKVTEIQQLIDRSHSIALVTVSDRELLTVIEQANYLHLNYNNRYIFKVEQGWKHITATYMGMHIAVDDDTVASTAEEWLIFLDQNKHFIQAVNKNDAALHLRLLAKPEWKFDNKGNLVRLN